MKGIARLLVPRVAHFAGILVLFQGVSDAALLGRLPLTPGETDYQAYYDNVLNITWLANANLAATQNFGVAGVAPSGAMNWTTAQAWITALNASSHLGVSTWRLPVVRPVNGSAFNYATSFNGSTDVSYNIGGPGTVYAGSTGSEMSHLYYNTLANRGYCQPASPSGCIPQVGYGLTNVGPFSGLGPRHYWSGTAYAPDSSKAWFFAFDDGSQWGPDKSTSKSAWPVMAGDIGQSTGTAQWTLRRIQENPSPRYAARFSRVSVDGNRVLVGAPGDDTMGFGSGRAYLFDAVSGDLIHTFENPSPAAYDFDSFDYFGTSVSVSGNRVLIGSYDGTTGRNSGRAYLFDAVSGVLSHVFENPAAVGGTPETDYFGSQVTLSGNMVLLGAPNADTAVAPSAGRAYLFDAVTGALLRTFESPTPQYDGDFGQAVSLDGSRVLVGASDETSGTSHGRAYLFDVLTGSLLQTFQPTSTGFGDFGWSVQLSGGRAIIGEPFYDGPLNSQIGRAYLFDTATGGLVHTLENPAESSFDEFGRSVGIAGNRIVVGAPGYRVFYPDPAFPGGGYWETVGRGYLFDAASGQLQLTFETSEFNQFDDEGNLGASVGISGDRILLGDPRANDATGTVYSSGRAYLYEVDSDGDGLADSLETKTADSDGDGIRDYLDLDSDGNGILDANEVIDPLAPADQDGDGVPDFQDVDNDGDSVSDLIELGPNPNSPLDWDLDGIPDYLDSDSQGGVGGGDRQPNPLGNFASQSGVPRDTWIISNVLPITGINEPAPVSVVNGEYSRNCTGPWRSTAGLVAKTDSICVRQRSSTSFSTSKVTTLTVGLPAVTSTFTTTTTADNQPNAFTFVDRVNVAPGTLLTSNTVTITGIAVPAPIAVVGGQYSINCTATFVSTPGTISNGQTVCVRHVNDPIRGSSTVLTAGGVSDTFSSTAGTAIDTTPDFFSIQSQGLGENPAQTLNVVYTTPAVTITGINVPTPISVAITSTTLQLGTVYDASASAAYSIGCYYGGPGDQATGPGLIRNGETVCVSVLTPDTKPYFIVITLTVGTVQVQFQLDATVLYDAVDTAPDFFSFAGQSGVSPSLLVTSVPVVVSGFDGQLPVSIPNGIGEYSIGCGGTFVAGGGYIERGQSLCVRHVSAATTGTVRSTQVKIGSVSSEFRSTTWVTAAAADSDSDGIPDALDNCINAPNGPLIRDAGGNSQWDTDGDAYGNVCDADINNSGTVTTADFGLLRSVLGQPASASPAAAAADMNGSGTVTTADFGLLRARLGTAPGPSGVVP